MPLYASPNKKCHYYYVTEFGVSEVVIYKKTYNLAALSPYFLALTSMAAAKHVSFLHCFCHSLGTLPVYVSPMHQFFKPFFTLESSVSFRLPLKHGPWLHGHWEATKLLSPVSMLGPIVSRWDTSGEVVV